jgi:hypothetical protein
MKDISSFRMRANPSREEIAIRVESIVFDTVRSVTPGGSFGFFPSHNIQEHASPERYFAQSKKGGC